MSRLWCGCFTIYLIEYITTISNWNHPLPWYSSTNYLFTDFNDVLLAVLDIRSGSIFIIKIAFTRLWSLDSLVRVYSYAYIYYIRFYTSGTIVLLCCEIISTNPSVDIAIMTNLINFATQGEHFLVRVYTISPIYNLKFESTLRGVTFNSLVAWYVVNTMVLCLERQYTIK